MSTRELWVGAVHIVREGEFLILSTETERLMMHRYNAIPLGQALLEMATAEMAAAAEGLSFEEPV